MTHTSTELPEALRLAKHLEKFRSFPDDLAAARELRRLHSRVQELEAAQAQRAPLTDAQIEGLLIDWPKDGIAFFDFARAIERAHGITQEKQP